MVVGEAAGLGGTCVNIGRPKPRGHVFGSTFEQAAQTQTDTAHQQLQTAAAENEHLHGAQNIGIPSTRRITTSQFCRRKKALGRRCFFPLQLNFRNFALEISRPNFL